MKGFNRVILLFITVYLVLESIWWIPRVMRMVPPDYAPVLGYMLTTTQGLIVSQLMTLLMLLMLLYCVYYLYTSVAKHEVFEIKTDSKSKSGSIQLSYKAISDYVNFHALSYPEFKKSKTAVQEISNKLQLDITVTVLEKENIPSLIDNRLKELKNHMLVHFGDDYIHSINIFVGRIIPDKKKLKNK